MKWFIWIFLIFAGCQSKSTITWGDFKHNDFSTWQIEANKRFHNPIIFACHGSSYYGVWSCVPESKELIPTLYVARFLHTEYPDKDIVLIVCNPGGASIHVDHVWYVKKNVWICPDQFVPAKTLQDRLKDKDTIGTIWDFVEY